MPTVTEIRRFEKEIDRRPTWPKAICLGDSWFQYPPKAIDLHKQLRRLFRRTHFWNDSLAGRESGQIKAVLPRARDALGRYDFDALLLSMGGNDVVGNELREYVKVKEAPQSHGSTNWGVIPAPVRDHIRLSAFEQALAYVVEDYRQIIQLRDQDAKRCIIVVHTYDYPFPDGSAFKLAGIKAGPWLKPYFDEVGMTSPAAQRETAAWLIDQFSRVLGELVSQTPGMRIVDSRGALRTKAQWANEIHPTKSGFARIARERWVPVLQMNGLLR